MRSGTKTYQPKIEKTFDEMSPWEKYQQTYGALFRPLRDADGLALHRQFAESADWEALQAAFNAISEDHERMESSGGLVKSPSLARIKAEYFSGRKTHAKHNGDAAQYGHCGKCSVPVWSNGTYAMRPTGRIVCVIVIATGRPISPARPEPIPAAQLGTSCLPCSCQAGDMLAGRHETRHRKAYAACALGAAATFREFEALDIIAHCSRLAGMPQNSKVNTQGDEIWEETVDDMVDKLKASLAR